MRYSLYSILILSRGIDGERRKEGTCPESTLLTCRLEIYLSSYKYSKHSFFLSCLMSKCVSICVGFQYLDQVRSTAMENIKCLSGAPGVQMHEVPPDSLCLESPDDTDPDARHEDDSRYSLNATGLNFQTVVLNTVKSSL